MCPNQIWWKPLQRDFWGNTWNVRRFVTFYMVIFSPSPLSPMFTVCQMSKITNDGLTRRSGTGCVIAVPIWQQRRQRVKVGSMYTFAWWGVQNCPKMTSGTIPAAVCLHCVLLIKQTKTLCRRHAICDWLRLQIWTDNRRRLYNVLYSHVFDPTSPSL